MIFEPFQSTSGVVRALDSKSIALAGPKYLQNTHSPVYRARRGLPAHLRKRKGSIQAARNVVHSEDSEAATAKLVAKLKKVKTLPAASALKKVVQNHGWGTKAHEVTKAQVHLLHSLLACTEEEAGDLISKNTSLLRVDEAHLLHVIFTLQDLLPHTDIASLLQQRPQLLLQADAMDRATACVEVLREAGEDADATVQATPLVLLYHHVWYSGAYKDPTNPNGYDVTWDDSSAMLHDSC
ncbi:hypothetical protein CYMTET_42734 [Cymbomonas tetramitiformis]|uniref:Uncharacterized protein n=1 Tax=Cymbomonas tetramitiformis TaxID=36881 RepID=A0AAE0F1D3_9CHLO|nr:hypothetical protein CYMTET_42734 [Cymbomonas tetramitiformis]